MGKKVKHIVAKAGQKVKWGVNDLLNGVGIADSKLPNSGSCTLIYHGITPEPASSGNTKFIAPDRLKAQLQWLKENATIVSSADIFQLAERSDQFRIAITFDDGFANNHKYLLPLVEELEIPVTVFVTAIQATGTDFLWPDAMDLIAPTGPDLITVRGVEFRRTNGAYIDGTGTRLKSQAIEMGIDYANKALHVMGCNREKLESIQEDFWRLMNEAELKSMAASRYITIGAHGLYHQAFDRISSEELTSALTRSKAYLEELTGGKIDQIAYPYGRYNEKVPDLVEEAGFDYQFAEYHWEREPSTDPRIVTRLGINPFISWSNQVKAIGNGKY